MREPERDPELEAELAAVRSQLERITAPSPSDALVARTLRLASAELGRAPSLLPGVGTASGRLPAGFAGELVRLAAAALPTLGLGALWATWLLRQGSAWLSAWLPADLAWALALGPAVSALTALGLVSASLPLFAHHRALLRIREEAT